MSDTVESKESGGIESVHEAVSDAPVYKPNQVNAALARSAKKLSQTERETELLREWLEGVSRDYGNRIKKSASAIDSLLMEEIRQGFVTSIELSKVLACIGEDYIPHTNIDKEMLLQHKEQIHEVVLDVLLLYLNSRHTSVIFDIENGLLRWHLRAMR